MLVDFLYSCKLKQELPESLHQKYMSFLKYYTLIWGMPEAVLCWIESTDIMEVSRVHASKT
ncbi:MAG: hypothetical protein KAR21_04610 [Spirochaetales bacterium]|nr:hypothetical protein [Spirochaetales bacterium]